MSDLPTAPEAGRRPWRRRMTARSPDEAHRAATPLELFFDLCFVVAVAQAAGELHHDLSQGHLVPAADSYLRVFFAIWWAWMNVTWFASAYDSDDDLYWLTTLVEITGALVLAAGVPRAFADADDSVVTYGYVIMRLALVTQWLRAARGDRDRRRTSLFFAVGVSALQLSWLGRLALPHQWDIPSYLLLVVGELMVPIVAENQGRTRWHPRHIAERYRLFTLIVLGEVLLAVTIAAQAVLDAGDRDAPLLLFGSALLIVFSMFWLYFDRPATRLLASLSQALFWGYGHYVVFASIAATGAGIAVAIDHDGGVARLSTVAAGYTLAVPVSAFLLSSWLVKIYPYQRGLLGGVLPITAALVLVTPWTGAPAPVVAVILVALAGSTTIAKRHRQARQTVG